jgi:DNA polymerase-3 subunit alpha
MRGCGLTDHGNVAGSIEMLKACRKEGIKPILGMESYLAKDHTCHNKQGQPMGRKGNRHINIIAKNTTGLQNLFTLSQKAFLDGFYYDPRIDAEILNEYADGLIVTSACPNSLINWHLDRGDYPNARLAASTFKEIFDDDFYLEIMYHGLSIESRIMPDIQKLSKELDIKMIASNDVHYIRQEDADMHEIVMCMSSNRCIKDPSRLHFPHKEFYFKSAAEMYKVFSCIPRAMSNTVEIAEKCDYSDIVFIEEGGEMRLPKFEIPLQYKSPYDYLEALAYAGIKKQGFDKSEKHMERLRRELSDIKLIWDTKRYDFATYFLIVKDIIDYARESKIDCGIRGSGYGSMLIKCLGISEGVDPLDLLWERFLGFDDLFFITEDDFGVKS